MRYRYPDIFCPQDFFKMSSRHVLKTSSRRLQRNDFSSSKTSSRRLQEVFARRLRDIFKTSWKTKTCYAEDLWKTSLRHILKMFSRRLENQQIFAGKRRCLCAKKESYSLDILCDRNVPIIQRTHSTCKARGENV